MAKITEEVTLQYMMMRPELHFKQWMIITEWQTILKKNAKIIQDSKEDIGRFTYQTYKVMISR